ncbi:MAG TPA: hypothetical protein VM657_04560 [Sphingomonas sp.]|nr:hypothetical protein [Sphingomonas sp.]
MEPVFYVIALMGCGDTAQACTQQRVEAPHYSSMAACRAAMPDAIRRNTDIDYPVISAACQASGPIMVERKAAPHRG